MIDHNPVSEAIERNHEAVRHTSRTVRSLLAKLEYGQSCRVRLPHEQPARRMCYQAAAGAAHYLFGTLNYSMALDGDDLIIHRKPMRGEARQG